VFVSADAEEPTPQGQALTKRKKAASPWRPFVSPGLFLCEPPFQV
jgi:hypothetical protein